MKKKKIFIISSLIIIAIIATVIIKQKYQIVNQSIIQIITEEQSRLLAEENNWDNDIITNVTPDGVPIPNEYTYVSGNKETGVIVEKGESRYLFIPYQEEVTIDNIEYYIDIEYIEPESDVLDSIETYNGFYVKIDSENSLDELKDISNSEYQTLAQQIDDTENDVNSHILNKTEISQINNYIEESNVDITIEEIGVEALTIDKFVKLKKTTTESNYVYMVNNVPIPNGFKYSIDNGIVSIQDKSNSNLIYVWIPMTKEELLNRKSELKALYESYTNSDGESFKMSEGSELYKVFNETTEELPQEYIDSISQYGGFYVSEAELSYDKNNNYYNKARGMVDNSTSNTLIGGDYYRGDKYSFNDLVKIAEDVHSSNTSVVSHIMYGVEYDAIVMNIKDTNREYTDSKGNSISTILLDNSTYVGKYINSGLASTSSAESSSAFLNKIWGLGGNLEELTLETTSDKSYVTRGGSYAQTGEAYPIASRRITNTLNNSASGIRTTLYIKPNLLTVKNQEETYEYNIIDDTKENIEDIDFIVYSKQAIWTCNFEGTTVYESPNKSSNKLATLPYATQVYLRALANTKKNDILWAKVELADGTYGFVSYSDLTNVKVKIDKIDFIKQGYTTRYYDKGIAIYDSPNTSSNVVMTADCNGVIKVIGKSISQTWAIVEIDNKTYYTLASKLKVSGQEENINGYKLILGMNDTKYVINTAGTNLLSKPGSDSVQKKLECAQEVILLGVSENKKYAKISIDSTTGYVIYDDLGSIKPEVSLDKTNEFLLGDRALIKGVSIDTNYKGRKITDLTEYEKNCILHMLYHEFGGDLNGSILVAQVIRDLLLLPKSSGGYTQTARGHADVLTVLRGSFSSHYCSSYTQCSYGNVQSANLKNASEAYDYVFIQGGSAIQHELLAYATTNCDFSYWPSHPYRVFLYNYTWYNGSVTSTYFWHWKI